MARYREEQAAIAGTSNDGEKRGNAASGTLPLPVVPAAGSGINIYTGRPYSQRYHELYRKRLGL